VREWLTPDRVARAALVLLVLALFREALVGGVFYERDIHLIWHPQIEGFVRAVSQGSLPLWDASPAFGQPLLADPGAQVLYPATWLNLLLPPWLGYTIFALGHVLFSALACHALARRWGLSPLASALGAATWALSGPYLSLVSLWHHFASASYLPAVLLAAEAAIDRRRVRDVLLLGLLLGLQVLGGSADYCAMTLLAVAVWIAVVHVDWRSPRAALPLLAGGAAALLLAAALSAGLWVAALDTASRSARRDLPEAVRTYWSLPPVGLAGTLLAGVPAALPLTETARAYLFEGREPFLVSLYLGLPALALAGAAFCVPGDRRRWALAVLGVGAALVALGRHAPFYDLATWLVPPLRVLRYPVKAMPVAAFAWAGLVAFGVDAWRSVPRGRRFFSLAAAPVAVATALAGAFAVALARPAWLPAALTSGLELHAVPVLAAAARGLSLHAALGASIALLALVRSPRGFGAALAGAVVVLDLGLAHPRPSPVAPRSLYTHRPEALSVLGEPPRARVYSYDYSDNSLARRWLGTGERRGLARLPAGWPPEAALALALQLSLAPQTPGRWGLRQAYDADFRGLQAEPLALLTRAVRVADDRPELLLRLLEIGAVTHVVALHRAGGGVLQPLAELPGLFAAPVQVLAVPRPWPRARVVAGARLGDGLEALGTLSDPAFDPGRSVLLARGTPAEAPAAFAGRASITDDRADRLRVEADLDAEGYLVLADSYDPGWRARVDGRDAEVLRANLAFRAVKLAAGHHVVEMVYRPPVVLAGLAVSALAAVALLLALVTRRR